MLTTGPPSVCVDSLVVSESRPAAPPPLPEQRGSAAVSPPAAATALPGSHVRLQTTANGSTNQSARFQLPMDFLDSEPTEATYIRHVMDIV